MIHLSNTRFGNISFEDSAAIEFPRGIIGFSEETRFAILERENGPIAYLQSLKNPKLALPILDASLLQPDYPDGSKEELAAMVNATVENLAILVVVHVDKSDRSLRANLLAPIVVDSEARKAWQIILDPEKYTANTNLSGPRNNTSTKYSTGTKTTGTPEATDCAVTNGSSATFNTTNANANANNANTNIANANTNIANTNIANDANAI
jgi:flagellar assembly factor FliW